MNKEVMTTKRRVKTLVRYFGRKAEVEAAKRGGSRGWWRIVPVVDLTGVFCMLFEPGTCGSGFTDYSRVDREIGYELTSQLYWASVRMFTRDELKAYLHEVADGNICNPMGCVHVRGKYSDAAYGPDVASKLRWCDEDHSGDDLPCRNPSGQFSCAGCRYEAECDKGGEVADFS